MAKLLIIGDFATTTGFARVNEAIANQLEARGWDISVLAINYHGDYHPLQRRYRLFPAALLGSDVMGMGRTPDVVAAVKPDVILLAQDSWNVGEYLNQLSLRNLTNVKIFPWLPVDAPNQHKAYQMNDPMIAGVIAPTKFGIDELIKGGYTGPTFVIPYGVDTKTFYPIDKREARKQLGFPEHLLDAFVVGRADRNSPRKRYDLSTQYFGRWWEGAGRPKDAHLYYHTSLHDNGWDLQQMAQHLGLNDNIIFTDRAMLAGRGVSVEKLNLVYNSWDAHFSTTLGEGWGFVAHESAACGVKQLLPRWSAYGEWMYNGAMFMRCDSTSWMTSGINTIGGIASEEEAVEWLDRLYTKNLNTDYSAKALAVARKPEYDWYNIGTQVHNLLKEVL